MADCSFAVSRLHLPNKKVLRNQVVVVKDDRVVDFFTLKHEIPFVEWRGGDFFIE